MFALVASIVSGAEFKRALSYQMAAMTMGSIFGPGLGSYLAHLVGYRLTFATSAFIFLCLVPVAFMFKTPPPAGSSSSRFRFEDFKAILPDAVSLALVYIGISFINPVIPWFLRLLGTPYEQLLTFTAVAATLNGAAFALATPVLTRVVTDRTLPGLPALAAGIILMTAFAQDPYQFVALRIAVVAIQAGVPPNLLGGRSGRAGTAIGFLNSARFIGMAIGPFIATSILGDGTPPRPLYMFATIAGLSLLASVLIYLTHTRGEL
jgi:predicted MFS family arabinose efflux permease